MPRTKDQFRRLTAIHNRLATGQRYTLAELIDACTEPNGKAPSERTVYNDIHTLRESYDAPIPENDRSGRPYYYRPGTSFSLHGAFSPDDAALANEVAALLRQLAHLPQFTGLEDVFLKLEQRAGVVGRAEPCVIQFEQNRYYTGLKWLKPLYEAIRRDVRVLVDYTEFGQPMQTYQFCPFLLKEFNNRWHVYGWATELDRMANLALDRITDLKPLSALRRRPDATDWDEYLADVIGFTRTIGEELQQWTVRVWFPRAHYVLTKPLHGSQRTLTRTDAYVDFTYELIWNREFEACLFELGPDAELLSPVSKRAEIADKARRLAERYNGA